MVFTCAAALPAISAVVLLMDPTYVFWIGRRLPWELLAISLCAFVALIVVGFLLHRPRQGHLGWDPMGGWPGGRSAGGWGVQETSIGRRTSGGRRRRGTGQGGDRRRGKCGGVATATLSARRRHKCWGVSTSVGGREHKFFPLVHLLADIG